MEDRPRLSGKRSEADHSIGRGLPGPSTGARFEPPDGTRDDLGYAMREGNVLVLRLAPETGFGFGKGEPYSQTRWKFARSRVSPWWARSRRPDQLSRAR